MALSVDNETLAIAVIVGAAALYYFTHTQQTEEEVAQKRDDDRKAISIRNLAVLERRYDALNLQEVMLSYEDHTKTSLLLILTDTERLQSEAGDIKSLEDGDYFERTAALIKSCRHYLTSFKEIDEDEAEHELRKKGLCATKNVGFTTNVAIVHNNFDQRRQSLQQTSIQAVIAARKTLSQHQSIAVVDARSVTFNQQNNELRQLNMQNPHSVSELNSDFPPLGSARGPQEVPQLNIQGALSHVTNGGSHNQSILDQRQTNTENRIVGRRAAPSSSPSLIEIFPEIRGAKVGSIHEVDVFNTAPPINRDNHDRAPAVAPVPPVGSEELANSPESNPAMFDEGGKSGRKRKKHALDRPSKRTKGVPPSPAARREANVKQKIVAVEMGDLNGQFNKAADRLHRSTSYQDAIVRQLEAIMTRLDKAYRGGRESDKQIYRDSRRQQMLDRINSHKSKFGVK